MDQGARVELQSCEFTWRGLRQATSRCTSSRVNPGSGENNVELPKKCCKGLGKLKEKQTEMDNILDGIESG